MKELIRVVETPLEGRYLVAASDIPAGALVHASDPFCICVAPEFATSRCSFCFAALSHATGTAGLQNKKAKSKPTSAASGGKMKSASYLALKEKLSKEKAKAAVLADKQRTQCSEAEQLDTEEAPLDSTEDLKDDNQPIVCSGCEVAVYCSQNCRKRHSSTHVKFSECLAFRLVRAHSQHRKPQEIHFLSIVMQIILRAAAEGQAKRLLAAGEETSSSKEAEKVSGGEVPPSLIEGGAQSPAAVVGTTACTRDALTSSTIPAEATRIRQQQERDGLEVVDKDSIADFEGRGSPLSDIMDRCSGSHGLSEPTTILPQEAAAWDIMPCEWCDFGMLVTNLAVISRDHLKDFHTLHRYFTKAIQDCPADIFGLPPQQTECTSKPSTTLEAVDPVLLSIRKKKAESSAAVPNLVGSRAVISEHMFYKICGAIQCNGFGVYNEADRCIAIGCFPFASYFNHSCAPNLCRVMQDRRALFYAIHDIPKGTPLCISYTDAEKGTSERRHTLLSTYRFYCECGRCAGSSPLSFQRCKACSAGGYLRPTRVTSFGLAKADTDVELECTICRKVSDSSSS